MGLATTSYHDVVALFMSRPEKPTNTGVSGLFCFKIKIKKTKKVKIRG